MTQRVTFDTYFYFLIAYKEYSAKINKYINKSLLTDMQFGAHFKNLSLIFSLIFTHKVKTFLIFCLPIEKRGSV
jgi:hypothetical protein